MKVDPAPEIFLDIEVLGLRPGAAIIEIGAVAFSRETGEISDEFHRLIKPDDLATADLQTLRWHADQGTWPRVCKDIGVPIYLAMSDFSAWVGAARAETFWSWGASFDFPHLDAAYATLGIPAPWRYSRCQCARTIWNVAFPSVKASAKPHHALEDAKVSALDLLAALRHLDGVVRV
jgi:hypothetical protein